jgi:hypothetical protein
MLQLWAINLLCGNLERSRRDGSGSRAAEVIVIGRFVCAS